MNITFNKQTQLIISGLSSFHYSILYICKAPFLIHVYVHVIVHVHNNFTMRIMINIVKQAIKRFTSFRNHEQRMKRTQNKVIPDMILQSCRNEHKKK